MTNGNRTSNMPTFDNDTRPDLRVIQVALIRANPYQPRTCFEETELEALSGSIKEDAASEFVSWIRAFAPATSQSSDNGQVKSSAILFSAVSLGAAFPARGS